jgi:hypothetical protein
MNPYLFTVTFLMMMSFLTSSETIRFAQSSLENRCYLESRGAMAAAEDLAMLSHLEMLRGEANENPPKREPKRHKENTSVRRIGRLNINTSRPPDNSRLNIYTLLHKEPHSHLPKEFSLYETLARLMRSLYGNSPFFNEIPQVEYHILDSLIEKKEKTENFKTPDELGTLTFDNPRVQAVFLQMLKGTKEASSLLNYITFDQIDSTQTQSRKINLLFADALILKAIFPEGEIVAKLLARREKIWAEIIDQEEHRLERTEDEGKRRGQYGDDLEAALEEVLTSEGRDFSKYKTYVFDCTLSEPGNVIFLLDPLTQTLIRQKYIARE